MLLHPLAQGLARDLRGLLVERRHLGRWRRWRRAQQVFQHPLAALDRAGARRVRSDSEHAGVPQHSTALAGLKRHLAELVALDARDAIVPRQPLIDKRVIAI